MQDFEEEIRKIKEKRSKMEMSEEGKEKIRKIIEARNARFDDNDVITYIPKRKKTYIFAQKIAAVFVCCLVLSSCAFAGEWKDLLTKIFYGEGANIEYAVDNGYVQNIEMDYVESNGIKIKADYFYSDDYYMYIAFDVVAEEEFEEFYLDTFEIIDEKNNVIFSNLDVLKKIFFRLDIKRLTKNNAIVLGKFSKIEDKFYNYSNLKININRIQLISNSNDDYIDGNWKLITEFSNSIIINEQEQKYCIDSKDFIENCKISYKNNILNIDIKFRDECIQKLNINNSNIYIQDSNNNTYKMDEISKIKYNQIITNFIVKDNFNKKCLKLNIENENGKFIFYLKKIDS